MPDPRPLPEGLTSRAAFTVADASALGVGRARLRRSDLVAPFHGVRSSTPPRTVEERAAAYLPRLRRGQVFCHVTAAVLLGMPVPAPLRSDPLHVAARYPAQAPRTAGVIGHRLLDRPGLLEVSPLPVTGAAETWCALGGVLGVDALVVAGDHLIRHGIEHPGCVLEELSAAIHAVRRPGTARLLEALDLLRPNVRSPMESLLRVVLVRGGLPEPAVNAPVRDPAGRVLGEGDLVYSEAREVLEYEGDGHRTNRRQFMKDIRRREDFADAGWGTTRITAEDLFPRRAELIARVGRRIGVIPRPVEQKRAPRRSRDARS